MGAVPLVVALLVTLEVELLVIGLLIPQSVLRAVVFVPFVLTPVALVALPQLVGVVMVALGLATLPVTLGVVFTAGFDTAELTLVLNELAATPLESVTLRVVLTAGFDTAEFTLELVLNELFPVVGVAALVPVLVEDDPVLPLLLPTLAASAVLLSNASIRINTTNTAAIREEQKVII